MIRGKKYFNKDVVYVSLKKHICPNCGNILKTVKVSKIVNYNSPEAKDFDFSFGTAGNEMVVTGDVKFVWKEFECKECKQHYTVEELKKMEGVDLGEALPDESKPDNKSEFRNILIFFAVGIAILVIVNWLKTCI